MTIIERIETQLAVSVTEVQRPPGGHTRSWRGLISTTTGPRFFAKVAQDERTATALRTEHAFYSAVTADWLPKVVDWSDGSEPILVLEDLSGAQWPPPWPHDSSSLFDTLADVSGAHVPLQLDQMSPLDRSPWEVIADEPTSFLALGVVDGSWLKSNTKRLIGLSSQIDLTGDDLVHADLGAENLCFSERGPIIIDWEFVCRGNRWLDVATSLLDLRTQSGSAPGLLPQASAWVALLSGFMGRQAAAPPPPWASDGARLRDLQRQALVGAIEWLGELEGW